MSTRTSTDDRRLRPPPLQTNTHTSRPSTAPHSSTPTSSRFQFPAPQQLESTPEETRQSHSTSKEAEPTHQPFVLTDPLAFRYLSSDPSTRVLNPRTQLAGYESYIVEQWTTSRTHPTFVITTFTGDAAHSIFVSVLSVPLDERTWSPKLRVYFRALNQSHAQRRKTPLGVLFVTNLSSFPSSLTVILVPNGDVKAHRPAFLLNENLKRLNCSGRVGLQLSPPNSATVAKFHQLYRTSPKNPVDASVLELVKLCQSALLLFGKLQIDYADGLLCDVTERAINDWWLDTGSEHYNLSKPHDGILGPTTVAALLGLLMGARNRLHACGVSVPKDAFDVEGMKRGISSFQKSQRLTRSRRLDRRTLDTLHKVTRKAAEHEGWIAVPRAVKSTVAELSGKGGEAALLGREKAGLAECETCEFERFVGLVTGERAKWLWWGKARKGGEKRHAKEEGGKEEGEGEGTGERGLVFRSDEQGGFAWTENKHRAGADKKEAFGDPTSPVAAVGTGVGGEGEESSNSDDDPRFKAARKRASGFKNEAKSGFDKIKGAVGFKGHQSKPSTDESPSSPTPAEQQDAKSSKRPAFLRHHTSPTSSPQQSPRSPVSVQNLDAAAGFGAVDPRRVGTDPEQQYGRGHGPPFSALNYDESKESLRAPPSYMSKDDHEDHAPAPGLGQETEREISARPSMETVTADASVTGSVYNGVDLNEALPEVQPDVTKSLRRTLSLDILQQEHEHRNDDAYPRHLSFSLAEESVLTWPAISHDSDDEDYEDLAAKLAAQTHTAQTSTLLSLALQNLSSHTATWTTTQLSSLQTLLTHSDTAQTTLNNFYIPQVENMQTLQSRVEGSLREIRERLEEGGKAVETEKAKLEYGIEGLRGKVQDVRVGVGEFEKGVRRMEERVGELEAGERSRQRGLVGRVCGWAFGAEGREERK